MWPYGTSWLHCDASSGWCSEMFRFLGACGSFWLKKCYGRNMFNLRDKVKCWCTKFSQEIAENQFDQLFSQSSIVNFIFLFLLFSVSSGSPHIDCFLDNQECAITPENLIHTYIRVGLIAPSCSSKLVPVVFLFQLVYYLRKHLKKVDFEWFWAVSNF